MTDTTALETWRVSIQFHLSHQQRRMLQMPPMVKGSFAIVYNCRPRNHMGTMEILYAHFKVL